MKVRKSNPEHIRAIVLDTLFYEIYLAEPPVDTHWAARAIEALDDAGLLDREETDKLESWYCRLRAEIASRRNVNTDG